MARLLAVLIVLCGALAAVLLLRLRELPPPTPPAAPAPVYEADAAAVARLAAAIRLPTIASASADATEPAPFEALAALLRAEYPRVHAGLKSETIGAHSLLYEWTGADPALPPLLLLAHQDVVPVEADSVRRWQHAPFSGDVADGYVWGRGTLDDKASLIAQLEAVESLLAQGFQPKRTIYFAFGHDEETGGRNGARLIAAELKRRKVQALFGLDEGGAITQGMIGGIARPVAMLMTAEKGYASFELRLQTDGGHSSMPPRATAIGRMARAVSRLERQRMSPRLVEPVSQMLSTLAPELPPLQRLAVANLWLFEPLLLQLLADAPATNALVRTTTAPTLFQAGVADNVLPSEARAVVNFRLLPGDRVDALLAHIRRVIDDPQISIDAATADEASVPTPTGSPAYTLLRQAAREVAPDALVAPGLVVGATDLRHYREVVQARFNFLPIRLQPQDLARIHGIDERIALSDFAGMVQFYRSVLSQGAGS